MKKIVLILYFLIGVSERIVAQNNNTLITPDGTTSPQKSLLSTTDVITVLSPAVSQLVYNTNAAISGIGADGVGYYFWNGTNWKKLAVGPVSSGAGSFPTTGIVLSETAGNSPLSNDGFTFTGKTNLTIQTLLHNNEKTVEWVKNSPLSNPPSPRYGAKGCILGNNYFIWGGKFEFFSGQNTPPLSSGAYIDLGLNNPWSIVSTNLSGRIQHSMVCNNSKAIIWGGTDNSSNSFINTGIIYDLPTNTWQSISNTNAPSIRAGHTTIMAGNKMIIWGGFSTSTNANLNTGAVYDYSNDTWTSISTVNAPSARKFHQAVWTGSKMIIWGGNTGTTSQNFVYDGYVYDISNDSWTLISSTNAPTVQGGAFWTGSKMLILGGGIYDFATNTWSAAAPSPVALSSTGLIDNNSKIIGFTNTSTYLYDISLNTWQTIPNNSFVPSLSGVFITDGNFVGFSWGGSTLNQSTGQYSYSTAGSLIVPTSYSSPINKVYYLFKKD